MYWEREQEVVLLWTVLEPLDPAEDARKADMIICGLIDLGLVDMDRAPVAQQAWQDEWNGTDVTLDFVAENYTDS